jgi:hypothetical protein
MDAQAKQAVINTALLLKAATTTGPGPYGPLGILLMTSMTSQTDGIASEVVDRAGRTCIFCGQPATSTEHIIPAWIPRHMKLEHLILERRKTPEGRDALLAPRDQLLAARERPAALGRVGATF